MISVALLIQRLFNVYELLIIVWVLLSWVSLTGSSFVADLRGAIGMLVEPYLGLFRRLIPPLGGLDVSPIVAIFALGIIERVVFSLIL